VLALFDGSDSGAAVLKRARELAGAGGELAVLLTGESAEQLEALRRQASAQLPDVRVVFHSLTAADGDRLAQRVRELAPSTLVVGELSQLGPRGIERLLERLNGAVLRVRH
jgi:UDP-N-acetyl-D-mannosaminuronic acid transferase (WecB/TagA/CpsF family)